MSCFAKRLKANNLLILLVGALFISCTSGEENKKELIDPDTLPQFTPKVIAGPLDHFEDLYFSYLGLDTFVKENGDLIFTTWDPSKIVTTSPDLNEIKFETIEGRGPGELLSAGRPIKGLDDKMVTWDQNQSRISIWDDQLNPVRDIVVEAPEGYRLVYMEGEFLNGKLLTLFRVSGIHFDGPWESKVFVFDPVEEKFDEGMEVLGQSYSPVHGGGVQLAFADRQLIAPKPETGTILFYDTRTRLISEMNSDLDTLRTIPVKFPRLAITDSDLDTVRSWYDLSDQDFKEVFERLPETKAPAKDMLYADGRIWLQSNQIGETDQWYVMTKEGEVLGLVNLPANSYLTHVSNEHLGVRLDEVTFALYENPLSKME